VNKDKGAVSMKACKASCIGCGKCEKECPFGAIAVTAICSLIDPEKCRQCPKCVTVCPTKAIHDVNFPTPAPAPKPKEPAAPKAETGTPVAAKADAKKTEPAKAEGKEAQA
jgi:ferredoxin